MQNDAAAAPAQRLTFEIKKFGAIVLWNFEGNQTQCPFCKELIAGPCIACKTDNNHARGEGCWISFGVCSHKFHFHCISNITKNQTTPLCAVCNSRWEERNRELVSQ